MHKHQIVTVATFLCFAIMTGNGWAGDKASVEMGKKLFSDPTLGGAGNAKTCATCHPDGKGLEQAGMNENLGEMISSCIVGALGGEALEAKSEKRESLLLYIKSLEKK
ncbi:MAG: cytochrome c peroxidase [Desulfocapsaceae bacterium]|nr:cytochrome c peroxidase [Desulfocapsaceae bacterium]